MHKLDFTTLLFSQLRPVDAAMLFARASVCHSRGETS